MSYHLLGKDEQCISKSIIYILVINVAVFGLIYTQISILLTTLIPGGIFPGLEAMPAKCFL